MSKYVCSVCGYVYDEAAGIPEAGIAPGTKWEDLPDNWACPLCGASKSEFKKDGGDMPAAKPAAAQQQASRDAAPSRTAGEAASGRGGDMAQMTPLEVSALCSNLARGCDKQYKAEEAALFTELAAYFKQAAGNAPEPSASKLVSLVEKDLEENLPAARAAAESAGDRGALRALTWSEKVTHIQKSLLARYEKEGDAMLSGTGVWVCTICGFIFIGDEPPALCPVCKVPSWKFEKIEGRAS